MFSGCRTNEADLLEAILKTYNATSMETKSTLSVNFDIKGETKSPFDEVLNYLKAVNNITVTANQKVNRSSDDTKINSQMDVNVNFGGISADFSVWVDALMNEESTKFVETIKVPRIATAAFPGKFKGKEYFTMDYSDLTQENFMLQTFNPAYLTKNLTSELTSFLKEYSKQFDPGFGYVESNEDVVINGESLNLYTLKLSDKTSKEFIRYFLNNFLDNKDAIAFLKGRAQLFMGVNMSQEEFDAAFKMFEMQIPEIKENINKELDKMDSINIFGDKGFNVDFLVNKDGYIVKEKCNIELNINENLGQEINVDINIESDMTKINQEVKIEYPKINSANSVSFAEIIREQKAEEEKRMEEMKKNYFEVERQEDLRIAAEGYASVKINNDRIYFEQYPRIIDGRLIAPIRPIITRMGVNIEWDPKTSSVICSKGDKNIVLKINSKDVLINGKKTTIDVAPRIIEGYTFMPVRVVTELFGGEIEWDNETKVANIMFYEDNFVQYTY
jgi:hypothetical protein